MDKLSEDNLFIVYIISKRNKSLLPGSEPCDLERGIRWEVRKREKRMQLKLTIYVTIRKFTGHSLQYILN